MGPVRVLTVVVLAMVIAVAGAAPASAHPTPLVTDPPADTALPTSPPVLSVLFNEAVVPGPRALALLDDDGQPAPVGSASTARDGQAVTAALPQALRPGTYQVRWQVTGTDGDQVDGEFRFAIGAALTAGGAADHSDSVAWTAAALRWLLFAGLAVSLGGLVGEAFTRSARAEKPTLRPIQAWVAPGLVLGTAAALGLAVVLVTGADALGVLWQDRAGQLLTAELAAFLVALALAVAGRRRRDGLDAAARTRLRGLRWSVAVPLLGVGVSEGVRAHAAAAAPGWGVVLTGVHVLAAAVWTGALLHVARTALAWREEPAALRWVFSGYTRVTVWLFLIVLATGTLTALVLVPPSTVLATTYGQILLVKLGLVAVAAGLALLARRRLRRSTTKLGSRGDSKRVWWTAALAGLTRVEVITLIAVLGASAVLVSASPPGADATAPPPARGPVIALGALAGQVSVYTAASEQQLVVRLATPRRGDYYAARPQQDYTLAAQMLPPRGAPVPIAFRGCGEGCFAAPVTWRPGASVLTLQPDAPGWRATITSLVVDWPTRPGGDDLARAAAALGTTPELTILESVTSDTTTPVRPPSQLTVAGAWFLAQEPYASGTASTATVTSPPDAPVRLALGFPAASVAVALTLDTKGRISEETLTDNTHLIHRRFVYPEPLS